MFLTPESDTFSFVAHVAVVAFVLGINLSRELPEHGRKGQYCHPERSEGSRPRESGPSLRSG